MGLSEVAAPPWNPVRALVHRGAQQILAELLTAAQGAALVPQIQVSCFIYRKIKKGFIFAMQIEELEYKKVSQWSLNVTFIWIHKMKTSGKFNS